MEYRSRTSLVSPWSLIWGRTTPAQGIEIRPAAGPSWQRRRCHEETSGAVCGAGEDARLHLARPPRADGSRSRHGKGGEPCTGWHATMTLVEESGVAVRETVPVDVTWEVEALAFRLSRDGDPIRINLTADAQ